MAQEEQSNVIIIERVERRRIASGLSPHKIIVKA